MSEVAIRRVLSGTKRAGHARRRLESRQSSSEIRNLISLILNSSLSEYSSLSSMPFMCSSGIRFNGD